MDEIKKALIDIALKFLTFIKEGISWKLVVTVLVIIVSWVAANQEGGLVGLLAAVLGALGIGGTFIVTKQKQNALIIQNGSNKTVAPKIDNPPAELNVPITPPQPAIVTGNVVLPHPGFNFKKFNDEVMAEVTRLVKESPDKTQGMARWEGIQTVGERYRVDNISDLITFSELSLQVGYDKFREAAGFDYDKAYLVDPKTGKTPLETLKPGCPYKLLDIAAMENGFYDELKTLENEMNLNNGVFDLAQSAYSNSWQTAFGDSERSFSRVRGSIMEILRTRGIK